MQILKKSASLLNKYRLKISINVMLVVFALALPKVGFLPMGSEGFALWRNIIFPFCHANIFHLACNVFCLWCMRAPYYIKEGVIISFVCSLFPEYLNEPIMGCSGIIFAIIGIKFGVADMFREMVRKTWLFFAITAFIPNVACLYHLYCIIIGFFVGHLIEDYRLWKR